MNALSTLICSLALVAPAADDLPTVVRNLVRQLDAPELAQREQAEADLIRHGPQILPLLPGSSARLLPEVRQRVTRIRQRLESQAQQGAVAASQVELPESPQPLSRLLDLLARQSGGPIVDYRARFGQTASDPSLVPPLRRGDFWPVFDALLERAGLTVYPFGQPGALSVVQREPNAQPRGSYAVYRGPFRFEPTGIWLHESLRSTEPASLRMEIELAWEPRLRPVYFRQRLADLTAVDDRERPLATSQGSAEVEISLKPKATATTLSLPLVAPARDARRIQRLAGRLMVLLPGPINTFRFALGGTLPEPHRVAGATVAVEDVRRSDGRWEVRVRLRFDNARDALQSHRGWVFENEAYLEGPAGQLIKPVEAETSLQSENELGMVYRFELPQGPAGHHLVYKSPTAILQHELEYEFKAVPLP